MPPYQSAIQTNGPVTETVVNVLPCSHIPTIPAHRFKAGAEYQITDAWKLGADLNVIGTQYLLRDDSNIYPTVPAHWVVNLHTSYQVTKNVEVFGLVQNLFNQRYYPASTLFNNSTLGADPLVAFDDRAACCRDCRSRSTAAYGPGSDIKWSNRVNKWRRPACRRL